MEGNQTVNGRTETLPGPRYVRPRHTQSFLFSRHSSGRGAFRSRPYNVGFSSEPQNTSCLRGYLVNFPKSDAKERGPSFTSRAGL